VLSSITYGRRLKPTGHTGLSPETRFTDLPFTQTIVVLATLTGPLGDSLSSFIEIV
jgi:hypothetical protein